MAAPASRCGGARIFGATPSSAPHDDTRRGLLGPGLICAGRVEPLCHACCHIDRSAARAIALAAPLDLLELACPLLLHIAFRCVQGPGQIPVDESLWTRPIGDGAESELRLPGHPDFAHEHDVEGCAERLGNLGTDSNAAERRRQDHRRPVFEWRQFGG